MDLGGESYLLGDEDLADARLSPLPQDVTGVAPAYLVTAGFDILLDEGKAYADKLRAAGVPVEYVCEDGLIHYVRQHGRRRPVRPQGGAPRRRGPPTRPQLTGVVGG